MRTGNRKRISGVISGWYASGRSERNQENAGRDGFVYHIVYRGTKFDSAL